MNESHDPSRPEDVPSIPGDSLDAGLAAGFGKQPPQSSLDPSQRPVLLRQAEGDSDPVVLPGSDALPPRDATGDRYQLFGEIARGGMGAVLRGRDVDLGRDLAVKVLLQKHAERPEVVRRFIEEAQIGGQLQHPGVVPVYDIGRFGELPFFTMKLVKGKTLSALLNDRTDPSVDRPRFLGIALQVAQALAYAHARGVIHRDLKPANIMVGAFGEVQVMDWGLAKVLPEGGIADEEKASRERERPEQTTIRTVRSGSGSGTDTEAGSLLGTPAYMPPEQANGDVALLDRRADVFGLGAILCEVLTGKPPYVGRSAEEVRRKAANGDQADALARLDGCGADQELIVLTKACLAPEAIDRPKDAQAVADALTAYLDGVQERLHQAELAEAEAKAKAVEEGRRRRLTLALAATVLLALTLGGGAWLHVKNERDARQAQVARDVNDALNRATALREQSKAATTGGPALFAQAREQTQRALALVESGPADETLVEQVRRLKAHLDEEEKDRTLITTLDEARLAQAETLSKDKRTFAWELAVPKFREAFEAYGLPAGEGTPEEAAERIRQRPAAVQEAIIAALNEWHDLAVNPKAVIAEPHRKWLRAVLEAADLNDLARQVRAIRKEKDAVRRRAALEKLAASADVAKVPERALSRLASLLAPAPRVALLRRAQRHHPADFWINQGLGLALSTVSPPERDEAVRFLTVASALRPDSPGCLLNLGVALKDKGKVDEAIECYHKAIAFDPKWAMAHSNLGVALHEKGKFDEAIEWHKKAIAVDPTYAAAHNNLGNALNSKGRFDEAIESCKQAIALDRKYAAAYTNLGNALRGKGKVEEAIACYQKAIDLDPRYAGAHNNWGLALFEQGKVDEAIAWYKKAIALDRKLANAHANLGNALRVKGKFDEGIAAYKKAIALAPKLASARYGLGLIWHDMGKLDQAIASYKKAIALDPKHPKIAYAHNNLGNILRRKGKLDEAIAEYRKAIALDRKLAIACRGLGLALKDKGNLDEAIECFHKAIATDPNDAGAYNNLGHALRAKGKVNEAIACFRKAIDLDLKNAAFHTNLGAILCDVKHDYDGAIACFRKAIVLEPKQAGHHYNLGRALCGSGRYAQARTALTRARTLLLADHPMRPTISRQLRHCERLQDLEARLPKILRGEDQPTSASERLDLVRICGHRKRYATATRFAADAFADPALADNLRAGHRYNAACHAALAAAGQGADAASLDDKDRTRLRRQALDWLRADLALCRKQLQGDKPDDRAVVRRMLLHWQQDSDLAGIRGAALDKLPAEEQKAFTQLWADVAALLKKAETPGAKEGKR
jgi:serine/threonine-protein kinase